MRKEVVKLMAKVPSDSDTPGFRDSPLPPKCCSDLSWRSWSVKGSFPGWPCGSSRWVSGLSKYVSFLDLVVKDTGIGVS